MWKETTEERARHYRRILQKSPAFYAAACSPGPDGEPDLADENAAIDKLSDGTQGVTFEALSEGKESVIAGCGEDAGGDVLPEAVANVCDLVLAPALHAYVLWVLRDALQKGKKRLYFLARDAYFMYRAAVRICAAYDLPLSCRYLSCSRYSVRIPLYHLDVDAALDYICRGGIDVTLHKILGRAGLTENEKQEVLEALRADGTLPYRIDEPVPYAKLKGIQKQLRECRPFLAHMTRHSKEAMPALLSYLRQEGLFDDVPSALVDSGWVGSMQKVLQEAIAYGRQEAAAAGAAADDSTAGSRAPARMAAADKPSTDAGKCGIVLEGWYWGLYELPAGVDPDTYHCFSFGPGRADISRKVYFSNCLFEAVFSAPHGMTLSYRETADGWQPVYARIPAKQQAFMKALKARFDRYTQNLIRQADSCGQLRIGRGTIDALLRLFMTEPTVQEAAYFGSLHFSDDVVDHSGQQLAAGLTQEELTCNHALYKILSMLGIRRGYVRESAWYEGSAVCGGQNVERHLRGYARYKKLLYRRRQQNPAATDKDRLHTQPEE